VGEIYPSVQGKASVREKAGRGQIKGEGKMSRGKKPGKFSLLKNTILPDAEAPHPLTNSIYFYPVKILRRR
jgi:hypothetical protein